MSQDVTKGRIVRYVMKMDFDLHDDVPNVCAAMVTKVRPEADGKPQSVALHVFTPNGGFVDSYVEYSDQMARGTWHWPPGT